MRRFLLLLLTWLVAAQMAWAGAAVCCVSELDGAPASEASFVALAADAVHDGENGNHDCAAGHCHCHHAGQAAPLAFSTGVPGDHATAIEPSAARRLKSHIPDGLERPNWLSA